jgi:hypothetical protein
LPEKLQIKPESLADEAMQNLLQIWFAKNDSIQPEFVERADDYDPRTALGAEVGKAGGRVLKIPFGVRPDELRELVRAVDTDTFGVDSPRADAGADSLMDFAGLLSAAGAELDKNDFYGVG